MNHFERFAYVVGTLLLGAATGLILSDQRQKRRRDSKPPVEELAKTLSQAWAPYHSR